MKIYIVLVTIISSMFLVNCSSKYRDLSNNNFQPPNEFSKHLFNQYKIKADFEAQDMHDWNSAKLYAEKALKASNGTNIKPEKISYWKINDDKINDLNKAYENLMIVYDNAIKSDPYHLAVAISSLDCWAEQQEEKWQKWDINQCKDDFLNAILFEIDLLKKDASSSKEELEETKLRIKNLEDRL